MPMNKNTYICWSNMKSRCNNPNRKDYRNYGGRGIRVCKRWDESANFHKDMGDVPKGMTLERKNNNGPYSKGNCRWVSKAAQSYNRRGNIFITRGNVTMCVRLWERKLGFTRNLIRHRMKLGWVGERLFSATRLKSKRPRKSK